MKKYLFILFLLFSLYSAISAQVIITYHVGYGSYKMKSLKEFQQFVLEDRALPGQIVEQFPGYINQRLYIGIQQHPNYKIYMGYLTTGGRISLSDYSGKWNFDMLVNGLQGGFHGEIPFLKTNKVEFSGYLDLGVNFSKLELKEYIKVFDEVLTQTERFTAIGFNLQPGLSVCYKIFPMLKAGCYLGYEQSVSEPFNEAGSSKAQLGISQDNLTSPDWSGIRTGIQISYTLGKHN